MSTRALALGMISTLILIGSATESRAQNNRVVDPEHAVTIAPHEQTHQPSAVRWSSIFLGSLYISTGVLQGLDVHSTLSSIRRGADEANPMMKGLVDHPAMFVATKAALTSATIIAVRSIVKRNKLAAIATLVAIDSLYVITVRHNYEVARGMR